MVLPNGQQVQYLPTQMAYGMPQMQQMQMQQMPHYM